MYTKAYLAFFYGIYTRKNDNGEYCLLVGEFDGADTFDNEQVVIDWNDGTTDTFAFSNKMHWNWKKEPVFDRAFFLNGVKADSGYGEFTVIKKPALGT